MLQQRGKPLGEVAHRCLGGGRVDYPRALVSEPEQGGVIAGDCTTEKVIRTVQDYAGKIGGDIEQIQFLLGHASIQTTEPY